MAQRDARHGMRGMDLTLPATFSVAGATKCREQTKSAPFVKGAAVRSGSRQQTYGANTPVIARTVRPVPNNLDDLSILHLGDNTNPL